MDDHEKLRVSVLKDIAKKYGKMVTTPQDKLDSYMEGLKLIRGNPATEAGQWDVIGDQYRRMNQLRVAKAAYQTALHALKKVDTTQEKFLCEEEKSEFISELIQLEKELLAKLKDLESME